MGLGIAVLLALGFAARLLPDGLAGLAWRMSCLAYALVCLLRGVDRRRFMAMAALFMPFLLGVAIDSAAQHDLANLADLVRQLFIVTFVAVVFGAAGDPVARRVGFWALLGIAGIILAYSLVRSWPGLSSGWSYLAARALKAKNFQGGFNANEVCFAGLVALLAGFRAELAPRWLTLTMLLLTALCSVLLAARAPVLALLAGAVSGLLLARAPIWAGYVKHPRVSGVAIALVLGASLAGLFSQIDAIAHSAWAPQLAGRPALWQIAAGAWEQRPLFGFGPGTFQDVIHANLGKAHFSSGEDFASLYALHAGGFHNLWLSVLVERGMIGLAGLFASWCLLVGFALRHGEGLSGQRRWLVATLLISLFLRGQVELAGLFDDADGPINAIVMIAIALAL